MNTAAAIRVMLANGLTLEQALIAIDAVESTMSISNPKSSAAERQRRYRERKAEREGVTKRNDVTPVTSQASHDVTTVTTVTDVTPESELPRARVPYGEVYNNIYSPPSNPPCNVSVTDNDQGGGRKGCVSKFFREIESIYPEGDHSQPRTEQAIAATPVADWPRVLAGARAYAEKYRAKPTTHPIALDRFIRERLFDNCGGRKTGPPKAFVEVGTPEWEARVKAGHKSTLRTQCLVNGRRVEGWHFLIEPEATHDRATQH